MLIHTQPADRTRARDLTKKIARHCDRIRQFVRALSRHPRPQDPGTLAELERAIGVVSQVYSSEPENSFEPDTYADVLAELFYETQKAVEQEGCVPVGGLFVEVELPVAEVIPVHHSVEEFTFCLNGCDVGFPVEWTLLSVAQVKRVTWVRWRVEVKN